MRETSRFLLAVLTLTFVATGCTPADPLEWKVHAKTPADFEAWREENLGKAPPALRQEFNHAFNTISSMSPRALTLTAQDLHKTGNAICARLHGRTIRQVLIEGYDLEVRSLHARISTHSDKLLENLKSSTPTDNPVARQRFAEVQSSRQANLAEMEARLEEIARRTKELAR